MVLWEKIRQNVEGCQMKSYYNGEISKLILKYVPNVGYNRIRKFSDIAI